MRMAAITLEKDLLRKVSRLGLDITKTSRISAFSNEGIVSVVNFLLGRYDPSWFWETCNYSLDENRRQCIRFLRLLDIAHLVNGPSELTPRNKRILRLLCALFEKLERKHGSALYQKPRQVLKPRPRRSTEKSQDNAGDKTQRATQTGKENDVDGGGSSLRTVGQGMRTPGRKERQADSQVNVAVPRSPPQTPQTPRRTVAESTEQLPTGPSRIQQATIGSSGSSRPVSGFATAATASPGSAAPAAEQSVTPTVSTANIAIAASAARSPMISQHIHSATGDGGRVTGTAGAAPAAVMHPSPAIRMAVPLLPSTALMKSLQVQIDELQKNISRTSQQQEELRTQQSRLSGNLQKMWAHYEFNLKLLRDLSSSNTGPTANITRLSACTLS
ncbi:uncharacterized protein LOC135804693 isoform X2 [Sycon ciliatum]|uniref:uncharacterized protein LOC135804693 isoform X2 n=1 Tax=Sycon ciliatum TaxID=27933 RepID=UPI0020AB2755|eukprot:scpid54378/ scgid1462/ 